MNYEATNKNNAAAKRRRQLIYLAITAAAIIVVQCAVIGTLWTANRAYRAMYDEALEAQQTMQQEINELRNDSEAQSDNQEFNSGENGEG
jgi:flagellar biosynthesis/type III secretory pathway M-ring protein FliF/YscJ